MGWACVLASQGKLNARAARDAGDVDRAAALDAEADVMVKAIEAGTTSRRGRSSARLWC